MKKIKFYWDSPLSLFDVTIGDNWEFRFFAPEHMLKWYWNLRGYEGIWREYSFGMFVKLSIVDEEMVSAMEEFMDRRG